MTNYDPRAAAITARRARLNHVLAFTPRGDATDMSRLESFVVCYCFTLGALAFVAAAFLSH